MVGTVANCAPIQGAAMMLPQFIPWETANPVLPGLPEFSSSPRESRTLKFMKFSGWILHILVCFCFSHSMVGLGVHSV